MKKYVAYVGSYSYTGKAKGITIFDVDTERGSFHKRQEVEVDNASDVIASSDGRMLYAVEDYGVVAFRILPDGGLVRVSSRKVNGMRPHHICVDRESKYLYTSGYHDGKLTILRLEPDGTIGSIVDEVYHKGLGSIAERGSRAHITCSKPTRDMRFVMSADPGIDQVSIYLFKGQSLPLSALRYDECDRCIQLYGLRGQGHAGVHKASDGVHHGRRDAGRPECGDLHDLYRGRPLHFCGQCGR